MSRSPSAAPLLHSSAKTEAPDVRPRLLKFAGLRSYRQSTEISFDDLGLFAIIGDTGAGKSTIIEALCLALYGRKTWSGGGNIADLIADGEDLWRVELTFDADGHTWKVTRARRRSKASPVDKLESTTNHAPMVDGAREVTRRVEELLGLECEQFTRAVVMPQGRFDELLRSTESERNEILKSILGLRDIDQTRELATAYRDELRDTYTRYTERRANLPADPARMLSDAEESLKDAVAQRELLANAIEAVDEPRQISERINGTLGPLHSGLAAVPAGQGDPIGVLRASLERGTQLHEELDRASEDQTKAKREIASIDDEQAAALAGFESRDALTVATSRLADAVEAFPADLERLEQLQSELGQLRAQVPEKEVPSTLVTALAEAEATSKEARRHLDDARTRADRARGVFESLTEARSKAVRAAAASEAATTRVGELEQATNASQAAVDRAEQGAQGARLRYEKAQRENAVAAIAQGHGPGDDCPVCSRELPDGFEAPDSSDLQSAAEAVASADGALTAARSDADEARQNHARALEGESAASKSAEEAVKAVAGWEQRVGEFGADPTCGDVEDAVAPLTETLAANEAEVERALSNEQQARQELATAEVELQTANARYTEQLNSAERALADSAKRLDTHRDVVAALPDDWRSDSPVTADVLADLHRRCTTVAAALDALNDRRTEAERRAREAEAVDARVRAEAAEEVTGPARSAIGGINTYLARVRDVVAAGRVCADAAALDVSMDVENLGALPESATTSELGTTIDTAEAALAAANTIIATAAEVAAKAQRAVASHEAQLAEILSHVDCDTADALHSAHGEAVAAANLAKKELAAATSNAAAAAQVDEVLGVVGPFHDNLVVLVAALANNQFVDHLLELREAELLAEASRRLRTISSNRFGFVSDFGVKNIASGEIRAPEALSGGERFQASLALALALVEIASRGGGRLDAVFVDEGFGSLDANALDTALATLGKVAGGGKLVALISHLRPVAEYVDTVMHVTRDDVTGSRIRTLSEEDRDRLLADDVRSRLTI